MYSLSGIGELPRCFEGSFAIDTTNTGASTPVWINPDAQKVSVQLKVLSTASAAIEATLSTIAEVTAGTADWVEWTTGNITGGAVAQDSLDGPVTAIRLNVKTAKAGNQAVLAIRSQGVRS